ncbi:glycosyltransferase family 4 protein [Candidatus Fermentibacterales bacterium]|nr:glycosyltransferase family 4 protein [Candidatus Fermentibacterales bacterium]
MIAGNGPDRSPEERAGREARPAALLATPIPPLRTGLATYAIRVLESTGDMAEWTVAYPPGGDPSLLPHGVAGSFELGADGQLPDCVRIPEIRIFQLGNSPDCFPLTRMLYRTGGTTILHELGLHHMLRFCYLRDGDIEEYGRELAFEYGPAAASVEKLLAEPRSEKDYDSLLKRYPLIGRAIHYSDRIACLNPFASAALRSRAGMREVLEIGHPLSPVDRAEEPSPSLMPGSPLVGMLGSNRPGRGLEHLLGALARLRRGWPSMGLVLLGSGYPEKNLPEWVRSAGRLPEAEYQGWIRMLDLAVDVRSPHCGETSGSLLEALRAGIPAVVSSGGSFDYLPSDAVLRIPAESIGSALAPAIDLLLSDGGLRSRMARSAALYASDVGSRDRLRSDWSRLLEPAAPASGEHGPLPQPALSAAWHGPLFGMGIDSGQPAVSWRFDGRAEIALPAWALPPVFLTVTGEGRVLAGDTEHVLTGDPVVLRIEGSARPVLDGRGLVTQITWRNEG